MLVAVALGGCFATVGEDGRMVGGGEAAFTLSLPVVLPPLIVEEAGLPAGVAAVHVPPGRFPGQEVHRSQQHRATLHRAGPQKVDAGHQDPIGVEDRLGPLGLFLLDQLVLRGALQVSKIHDRLDRLEDVERFFPGDAKRREQFARTGSTLVGDCDPGALRRKAGRYTPVSGGVGPLTIAMLLANTVTLARTRRAGR